MACATGPMACAAGWSTCAAGWSACTAGAPAWMPLSCAGSIRSAGSPGRAGAVGAVLGEVELPALAEAAGREPGLARDALDPREAVRGVQPACRREVARGVEHDPALARCPRVVQHPAHEAPPDAEPARGSEEQTSEL